MPAGKMVKFQAKRKSRGFYKKKMPFNRRQVKAIKKLAESSGELKSLDGAAITSASLISGTGVTFFNTALSAIPQGDGEAQRIGDQLRIKDLHARFLVDAGTAQGAVRVTIFQQLEDVLPAGVPTSTGSVQQFWPNIQTSLTKYQKLYDKVVYLDGNGKSSHLFDIKIPASKLMIKKWNYDSGATSLTGGGQIRGSIMTNNLTALQMTVNGVQRIRYYD